jgi:hypothetical protein
VCRVVLVPDVGILRMSSDSRRMWAYTSIVFHMLETKSICKRDEKEQQQIEMDRELQYYTF